MGDGVGVPSLGEHRYRHHAPDVPAQLAGFADGVHHFPKDVLVGEVVSAAPRISLGVFGLELVDLAGSGPFEVSGHGVFVLELFGVDEDRLEP